MKAFLAFFIRIILFIKSSYQIESCLGYDDTRKNCLDCSYLYYHSPNISRDNSILPSNCTLRLNESLQLRYFISTKKCLNSSLCNGTEQYPFDEINKALWKAHVESNMRTFSQIEFYILGSPHYILKKNLPFINIRYFQSINANISMMPCYCDFKNLTGCFSSGDSATIYVKTDSFSISITSRLTMKNLIFNGTDLNMITAANQNDLNACYNKEQICCSYSQINTIFTSTTKTPCALINKFITSNEMSGNSMRGFLSMDPNIDSPLKLVPEVYLENINFTDIYAHNYGYSWQGILMIPSNTRGILIIKNLTFRNLVMRRGLLYSEEIGLLEPKLKSLTQSILKQSSDTSIINISNFSVFNINKYSIDYGGITQAIISLNGYLGSFQIDRLVVDSALIGNNVNQMIAVVFIDKSPNISLTNTFLSNINSLEKGVVFLKIFNSSVRLINTSTAYIYSKDFIVIKQKANLEIVNLFCKFNNFWGVTLESWASEVSVLNFEMINSDYLQKNFVLENNTVFFLRNAVFRNLYLTQTLIFAKNSYITTEFLIFENIVLTNWNLIDLEFYNPSYFITSGFYAVNISLPKDWIFLYARIGVQGSYLNLFDIHIKNSVFDKFLEALSFDTLILKNINLNSISSDNFNFLSYNSFNLVAIENLLLEEIFTQVAIMNIKFCLDAEGCLLIFKNISAINVGFKNSDWISLSGSKLEILDINISLNCSSDCFQNKVGNIIYLNSFRNVFISNSTLNIKQHSFKSLYFFENINSLSLNNIFITNNLGPDPLNDFFSSGISCSKGYDISLDNIIVKNLRGNPEEIDIRYKNGALNFFGSQIDLVRKDNDIKISIRNVLIDDCRGFQNGVIGLTNIATVKIENVTFNNVASEKKGGALFIAWASIVSMENINISHSRSIEGGAFFLQGINDLKLKNIDIADSSAEIGGSFFLDTIDVADILSLNAFKIEAKGKGGLFYLAFVGLSLKTSICDKCESIFEGGVIFNLNGTINLEDAIFKSPRSAKSKGGVGDIINSRNITLKNISIFNAASFEKGVTFYILDALYINLREINLNSCLGLNSIGNIFVENYLNLNNQTYFLTNIICLNNIILEGSCLNFQINARLEINNITITENIGTVLILKSKTLSFIKIINLFLSKNGGIEYSIGSIAIFENLQLRVGGSGNEISKNRAKTNLLQILNSNFTLNNCMLFDNMGISPSLPFYDIYSENGCFEGINISRLLKLDPLEDLYNSFILVSAGNLELNDSLLTDCKSKGDSACVIIEYSQLAVLNKVTFMKNVGEKIGVIAVRSSNITFTSCQFARNFQLSALTLQSINKFLPPSELRATDIVFLALSSKINSFIHINNCDFNISLNSLSISIYQAHILIIINSNLKGEGMHSSGLLLFNSNADLRDTKFQNLKEYQGGGAAIKFLNLDNSGDEYRMKLSVQSCYFLNNQANQGGSVLLQGNMIVIINASQFINNKVEGSPGIGGALYFACLMCETSFLNLTNNHFQGNRADNFGPNAFSQGRITASDNTYENNTDEEGFTEGLAGFPVTAVISPIKNMEMLGDSNFSDTTGNQNIIGSGQKFEFNLKIVDFFGNQLLFDNRSSSNLKINNNNNILIFSGYSRNSTKGIHLYEDVRVVTAPYTSFSLIVEIDFDEKYYLPLILEKNPYNNLTFTWDLFSRACLIGEIRTNVNSCVPCEQGKFSLNDPMQNLNENGAMSACKYCPLGAFCPGRSDIIPDYGYWRAHSRSSKVVECLSRSFCLGGLVDSPTLDEKINGRCLSNHEGSLCYKCKSGYARSGTKGICEACNSNVILQFKMIIALLLVFCYIILQIRLTFTSESQSSIGILMKQLLSHAQLIQMISVLDFGWTPNILDYFRYQEYFSFLAEEMVSLDCVHQGIDEDNLVLRIITANLTPVAAAIFFLMNLMVYALYTKQIKRINIAPGALAVYAKVGVVIIVYVFFPEILRKSFSLLNCIQIDDAPVREVVLLSPESECWNDMHFNRIYKVSLPGILIWGIVIPLLTLLVLVKNRTEIRSFIRLRKLVKVSHNVGQVMNLSSPQGNEQLIERRNKIDTSSIVPSNKLNLKFDLKTPIYNESMLQASALDRSSILQERLQPNSTAVTFKFIYRGYREKYFYWELIIFVKKLVLIIISSFTDLFPSNTKATFLLVVISFFLLLQVRYQPFELVYLNKVEVFSLLVTFITANVGIMLYSEDLKSLSVLFLAILIGMNFLFVCYWFFIFIREIWRGYISHKVKFKQTKMN